MENSIILVSSKNGTNCESFYFIYLTFTQRVGFTLQFSLLSRLRPDLTVEKPSIMEGTKNK